MTSNTEENHRRGWKSWIAPALVSAAVFGVLTTIEAFSFWGAMLAAVAIVVAGVVLLRRI